MPSRSVPGRLRNASHSESWNEGCSLKTTASSPEVLTKHSHTVSLGRLASREIFGRDSQALTSLESPRVSSASFQPESIYTFRAQETSASYSNSSGLTLTQNSVRTSPASKPSPKTQSRGQNIANSISGRKYTHVEDIQEFCSRRSSRGW